MLFGEYNKCRFGEYGLGRKGRKHAMKMPWKRQIPKRQIERFADLRDMLDYASAAYGENVLYRWMKGNDLEISEMTFRKFRTNVNRLGTALTARGLRTSRIAILSESRPEWMTVFCSVICGDGLVIPMDRELAEDHIADFLSLAEAEAIFCSAAYIDRVRRVASKVRTLRFVFCFDAEPYSDEENYQDLLAKGKTLLSDGYNEYMRVKTHTDKACTLLFTSGTTGTSKGVMLSQNNLMACLYHSTNMVDIHPGDVLFSVLPFHHTYELVCGQLGGISLGTTICINSSVKYFMRNIKLYQPTAMIVVPVFVTTLYRKITEEISRKRYSKVLSVGIRVTKLVSHVGFNLSSVVFYAVRKALGGRLRYIVCGGAALDADIIERVSEFGIKICQGYGITECSPLVCVVPYNAMRKGSVGLPAYGTEVKAVVLDDDGKETEANPNVIGELYIRSEQVMLGYYLDSKATKAAMTPDGFFRSGDYGYVDSEGYVYITGRKKNIIILSNGKNVYPEELEEYLYQYELVKDCVVVARPQENAEALITAVIYPDFRKLKDKSDEEIIAAFKEIIMTINRKLPSFKQIRNIELKKTEFDKTTTQKIQRYKV